MQTSKITGELSVSAQLMPGDIAGLAVPGVRAIVCNWREWLAMPKS